MLGCRCKKVLPSHPNSEVTREGADARKAFRQRIVTSWPSATSKEDKDLPISPVPPAKTMLKASAIVEVKTTTSASSWYSFMVEQWKLQ